MDEQQRPVQTIEISLKNPLIFIGILVAFWLMTQIVSILTIIFVSFILASALKPLITRLHEEGVPRVIAVLLVYVAIFGGVLLVGLIVIPPIFSELKSLVAQIPGFLDGLQTRLGFLADSEVREQLYAWSRQLSSALSGGVLDVGGNVLKFTFGAFGALGYAVTIAVLTFYILLEEKNFRAYFTEFLPMRYRERTVEMINRLELTLGDWMRAQILLCISVGLMTYLGFLVLGALGWNVSYILALALVAGILEIVPLLGPLIAAIPAIFVVLSNQPDALFPVLILYIVVQQAENNFLVPKIMQRQLGINPLISLVAILIGGRFMGTFGVLLAIPLVAAGRVLIHELYPHTPKP